MGAKVAGYSLNPKTEADFFVLTKLSNRIIDLRGDIRDFSNLKSAFDLHKPEIIFHLAAQPLVADSYINPVLTYETNVMGTVNLLNSFQDSKSATTAVIITTDKVYKNKERSIGYTESDELGGHDPYSSSKAAVELLVDSWRLSFAQNSGKSISSVRAGNVIGGGDWSLNRLIPDLFAAIYSNATFSLRNPNSIRPWQHVLEPLFGYLLLACKMQHNNVIFNSSFNFGPDENLQRPVIDIVSEISKISSFKNIVLKDESNIHETKTLRLDSSKALQILNWSNKLDFKETIKLVTDWYLHNENNDYAKLANNQIEYYESKIWPGGL